MGPPGGQLPPQQHVPAWRELPWLTTQELIYYLCQPVHCWPMQSFENQCVMVLPHSEHSGGYQSQWGKCVQEVGRPNMHSVSRSCCEKNRPSPSVRHDARNLLCASGRVGLPGWLSPSALVTEGRILKGQNCADKNVLGRLLKLSIFLLTSEMWMKPSLETTFIKLYSVPVTVHTLFVRLL